jgi:hypothetical protein
MWILQLAYNRKKSAKSLLLPCIITQIMCWMGCGYRQRRKSIEEVECASLVAIYFFLR